MSDTHPFGEGIRQRNLSRLLRLVHREGPLSRAALTEATALNRSTIADLVAELVRTELVVEGAPEAAGRVGRPSPLVSASGRVVALAANPEVDALEIAAVGLDRTVVVRERIDLDHLISPEHAATLIAERASDWAAGPLRGARVVGVGLAIPGLVRASDGIVRSAPHLGWTDVPVRDLVAAATGLPVTVGNDASLGAMAEHLFGAARGIEDVVYLNGGASGIGGGLIVHGMPVGGAGGYAGEFGQNRPGIASASDRLAGDGVLEDEVSRARLLAVARLGVADEPTLARALAGSTDLSVTEEIARQRRILSTALANAVNVLNPAVIVLGGFLATLAAHDVPGLQELVRLQAMPASAEDLDIRPAELAQDRLLVGAAEAAFAALLNDPSGVGAAPVRG